MGRAYRLWLLHELLEEGVAMKKIVVKSNHDDLKHLNNSTFWIEQVPHEGQTILIDVKHQYRIQAVQLFAYTNRPDSDTVVACLWIC